MCLIKPGACLIQVNFNAITFYRNRMQVCLKHVAGLIEVATTTGFTVYRRCSPFTWNIYTRNKKLGRFVEIKLHNVLSQEESRFHWKRIKTFLSLQHLKSCVYNDILEYTHPFRPASCLGFGTSTLNRMVRRFWQKLLRHYTLPRVRISLFRCNVFREEQGTALLC